MAPELTKLSEHLYVYPGPINVGVICDGARALVIDCGDARVLDALRAAGIETVDEVLFTHHHRDQACGAWRLAEAGTRIVVPAAERDLFDKVDAYWNDPKTRWHLYHFHPHHLSLAEPVRVDTALSEGDMLEWGPAKIGVLATPGHTDGSVSYVVDADGRRTVFSGDVIADAGKVWDVWSLQKGTLTRDYHGFLGARPQLKESLGRIEEAGAATLVPSHGAIMNDPPRAIEELRAALDRCYDKYAAISAMRLYHANVFAEYDGRAGLMPIHQGKAVPACLRHFGTTWLLVSRDGAAFVMDCGDGATVKEIRRRVAEGEVRRVEGLWITHYHDDHTDGIPEFQQAFDCPCITDRSVAEVITDPLAWRLPCISPHKARVDRATTDGESWKWHEYRLTAYHFPGQTLYHSGLLVEGEGLRMFFAGDSFTMAGIDDYCAGNRNWLGRGTGYDHCIALIEKLRPTHIFNPHVAEAFAFTAEECRFMRANLAEREKLFGDLVPWDHANFGMDESWVRCAPYEQVAAPGHGVAIDVVVTNHAEGVREVACRAVPPRAWGGEATEWGQAQVAAKKEGRVRLVLRVPPGVGPGRYVVPVDVVFGGRELPEFAEAIVVA
jgi:glyoxylase-like metal-dependent hydrolase (beta-lactamase superfamily II)